MRVKRPAIYLSPVLDNPVLRMTAVDFDLYLGGLMLAVGMQLSCDMLKLTPLLFLCRNPNPNPECLVHHCYCR